MADFLTWGQALDYTIRYKKTWQVSHPPSKTVRINANHATQYWSRGQRIADINQGAIDRLMEDYCKGIHDHTNTTVKKIVAAVQTCLNYCIDSNKLEPGNPRHQDYFNYKGRYTFESCEENKVDRYILNPSEIDHFHACAKTYHEDLLAETIWLATYTMTSHHEWAQIQPRDLVLGVPTPYIKIGFRPDFKIKRGCRARNLFFPVDSASGDRLFPMLIKYAEEMKDHPTLPIWGDYFDKETLRRKFNAVRDYAGIDPRFTPNCCRHSGITWMAWNDVHPEKTRLIAGHADMKTTLKYYTHMDHNQLAEAQSRVGDRLPKPDSQQSD